MTGSSGDLVHAVAAHGLLGSTLELPDHPLEQPAFDDLLRQVQRERLTGLLTQVVLDGRLTVTEEQEQQVLDAQLGAMGACLRLEGALVHVVGDLEASGVHPRVLKGSAAASLDYPDPSWRQFVDVDLLVRSEEFDRAAARLLESGFTRPVREPRPGFDRRFGKGATFVDAQGLEVDLHRTFVMGPFGLTVDLDELWGDGEPFSVAGHRLTALDPQQRLLHACFHTALGDRRPRVVPQRDIVQLVLGGRVDPMAVLETAERWRAEAVVADAVRRAWTTLGVADATALSVWAQRYEPTAADARALAAYRRAGAHYAEMSWLALRALRGPRARISFALSLAFPAEGRLGGRRTTLADRARRALRGLRSDRTTTTRGPR